MDGQHQYEITLKKDDLFINLSSDDVYFISKQMDKWFRILLDDSYVPVTLPSYAQPAATTVGTTTVQPAPVVPVQPMPEPAPMQPAPPPVMEQPTPIPEPVPQPAPPVAPVAELPPPQPVMQPAAEAPQPQPLPQVQPEPQPVAAQAAPVELPVAQPQPQPPIEQSQPMPQVPAAVMAAPQPVAENADFEAVMDSVMKDLEDPDDVALVVPDYAPVGHVSLDESAEPDLSYVTSLADLCDRSSADSSEDYLLLSAYYLTRVEQQGTFPLKKINSALVRSGLTPINHSVLESVLSRGHLSMVPDLTGLADVSEYSITTDGRDAVLQLL